MALFTNSANDWQRLDWTILRDGGISLYWRREYLAEDVRWLVAQGYDVYDFDCERWTSQDDMYSDITRVLRFAEWWGPQWGKNFDALDDCLSDLPIRDDGGAVLVFNKFNVYATGSGSPAMPNGRIEAEVLLDVIAGACRFFLLNGKRFITLVQTEDPNFRVEGLGAVSAAWNRREWLDQNRTPESRRILLP
jgi:hypothetical protein